jgi:putative hydrolase of the HAD superfamily
VRRIFSRAVFLDAGGVIVLPHRQLVADALGRAAIEIRPERVPHAHYAAVTQLDRNPEMITSQDAYFKAFATDLGVAPERVPDAIQALLVLADRDRSGEILWSEPAPGALAAMASLARAGVPVVIVSNSDGRGRQNLRDAGICEVGRDVTALIDSTVVGSSKPDPGIFRAALGAVGVDASAVVHVGDTLAADVAGALAAGITPIHVDPGRSCRARDHRHITSLAGLGRHVRFD